MVHCALPPWRLILLEGMVASEASYPAWPVTEKARPKVLVFLSQIDSLVYGHGALRIKKCLSQAVQGVKPEASSLNNP